MLDLLLVESVRDKSFPMFIQPPLERRQLILFISFHPMIPWMNRGRCSIADQFNSIQMKKVKLRINDLTYEPLLYWLHRFVHDFRPVSAQAIIGSNNNVMERMWVPEYQSWIILPEWIHACHGMKAIFTEFYIILYHICIRMSCSINHDIDVQYHTTARG